LTDRRPIACPICGKPATLARHPFCGTRCADVDLGRWLTGQYRVPGEPAEGMEVGGVEVGDVEVGDVKGGREQGGREQAEPASLKGRTGGG
jgi:endogenous inhibitor of DNA gyrase (YacG/DUF329 family)